MIEITLFYNRRDKRQIEIKAYDTTTQKRRYYTTKINVLPNQWNEVDKKVNNKNSNANEFNFILRNHIQDLENLRLEKRFKNLPFTFDDIKLFLKRKKQSVTNSFIEFANNEIKADLTLKEKTKKQHRNTLKILQVFTNGKDILFSEINFAFVDSFNNFLKSKSYQQNTIHKHHKNIKKFIGLALKKEITDIKNPYDKYKVKSEQKPCNVLTMQDVQGLVSLTTKDIESKPPKNT